MFFHMRLIEKFFLTNVTFVIFNLVMDCFDMNGKILIGFEIFFTLVTSMSSNDFMDGFKMFSKMMPVEKSFLALWTFEIFDFQMHIIKMNF